MDRLSDLEAFLAVVEQGGLTPAARQLRRSLQSVSRSLAALEAGLGVVLIQRTTRQSRPTEAGLALYGRLKPALAEIEAARTEVTSRRTDLSGVLRLTAPVRFAPAYLVPLITEFMAQHPKIEVELQLSDRRVDLVEEGVDLAVRIGVLADSDLKARRLGLVRQVVFGAPSYFDRHGRPQHPSELTNHHCLTRLQDGHPAKWPFRIGGKLKTVPVSGRFRADASEAIYAAAKLGLGVGFTPLWQIRSLVEQGDFEIVLADFELEPGPIHAVWPGGRGTSAKVRAFLDFLAARLSADRL